MSEFDRAHKSAPRGSIREDGLRNLKAAPHRSGQLAGGAAPTVSNAQAESPISAQPAPAQERPPSARARGNSPDKSPAITFPVAEKNIPNQAMLKDDGPRGRKHVDRNADSLAVGIVPKVDAAAVPGKKRVPDLEPKTNMSGAVPSSVNPKGAGNDDQRPARRVLRKAQSATFSFESHGGVDAKYKEAWLKKMPAPRSPGSGFQPPNRMHGLSVDQIDSQENEKAALPLGRRKSLQPDGNLNGTNVKETSSASRAARPSLQPTGSLGGSQVEVMPNSPVSDACNGLFRRRLSSGVSAPEGQIGHGMRPLPSSAPVSPTNKEAPDDISSRRSSEATTVSAAPVTRIVNAAPATKTASITGSIISPIVGEQQTASEGGRRKLQGPSTTLNPSLQVTQPQPESRRRPVGYRNASSISFGSDA